MLKSWTIQEGNPFTSTRSSAKQAGNYQSQLPGWKYQQEAQLEAPQDSPSPAFPSRWTEAQYLSGTALGPGCSICSCPGVHPAKDYTWPGPVPAPAGQSKPPSTSNPCRGHSHVRPIRQDQGRQLFCLIHRNKNLKSNEMRRPRSMFHTKGKIKLPENTLMKYR